MHHDNEEEEGPVDKWTRDAISVRKWLDKADESVEADKPVPVLEVSWKVLVVLRKKGRKAPRPEELQNEATTRADMRGGRQDEGKKPTKSAWPPSWRSSGPLSTCSSPRALRSRKARCCDTGVCVAPPFTSKWRVLVQNRRARQRK